MRIDNLRVDVRCHYEYAVDAIQQADQVRPICVGKDRQQWRCVKDQRFAIAPVVQYRV